MKKRRLPRKDQRRDKTEVSRSKELVDLVSQRLRAARRAWNQGERTQALRLFEDAVRSERHNVRAWLDAARAYASLYRFERTDSLLNQLRQRSPNHPGVHHLAGEIYSSLKIPDRAVQCYERACQLPGVLPMSCVELASLYQRANRLDEALELAQRALHARPELPSALLVRSRIERSMKENDRAEATLRLLLKKVPEGVPLCCHAWAELSDLKDKQGDYAGAMEAIEHCKKAQLSRDTEEWRASEHVLNRFQRMIDTITQDDFTRWHNQGQLFEKRRVALLTGFPRSGTTLLEQVLDTHPDLVSSEERDFLAKEFFPSLGRDSSSSAPVQQVLDDASNSRLRDERGRYFKVMESLLGESIGSRVHLDKNPAYNPAIPIMLRLFPEAKLLIALRDPRDVVLSCYLRFLPLNPVSVRFLTLERTADRYALDMRAWIRFREMIQARWCEVRYEDAVDDLEGQTRRMLDTLDLPWDSQVMQYRDEIRKKQLSSPSYEAVARPVTSTAIGRWKNYQQYLDPIQESLEPYVKAFGYD